MLSFLKNTIFNLTAHVNFEQTAIELFRYQAAHNSIYSEFVSALGIQPDRVASLNAIPFLPIQFFKSHAIKTGNWQAEEIFLSSGTTGTIPSKHHVKDLTIYEESFLRGFEMFYGKPSAYCVLALLPAYLERKGSSLVYMANALITKSGHPQSGFYLSNYEALMRTLHELAAKNTPTLLLGVSFALLDIAEKMTELRHNNLIVMETGGMKGRRKEIIRAELHQQLMAGFGVSEIHSEYGMTELLSQAYAMAEGVFKTPPWMKVLVRDTTDPLAIIGNGGTGGLNIIDLANMHSCSFIATEDLGRTHNDGTFEVLGRYDQSDIRGCNLMAL